jgi:phosphopantetheinyl transferase
LIRDLAQRGGPSLASYFPYIRFIEPDYVINAFIRPNFISPAFGLVSIPHINLAHSQGFALIVVLNCYS